MAAALPFLKLDDGSEGFASNCFPVRAVINQTEDAGGAWLVAQRAEQRRRFKAVLCAKPRTYSRIKEERKKADRQGTNLASQSFADDVSELEEEVPLLDGFFLMKHCCVEDPVDLCSVNIAGKQLCEFKEEDFQLFDNVAYVNAGENFLPFEAFRGFPILRELEVPLNAIRSIKLKADDYPFLEMVDVSYNNLSHDDLLALGMLPHLKVLHLTGNHFRSLPPDMAVPFIDPVSKKQVGRFSNLEILMLDDNCLNDVRVFSSLAGMKRLKHLNMEKNEIFYVPQLKSVEGTMIVNDDEKATKSLRRSAKKSARGSARAQKAKASLEKVANLAEKREGLTTEDSNPPLLAPANTRLTGMTGEKSKVSVETPKDIGHENDPDFLNVEFSGTLGDLSVRIQDLDLNMDTTPLMSDRTKDKNTGRGEFSLSSLPPFPELRYINLAYNQIEEEEALLAVAAWPLLMELVIHNNPLTTQRSGDPPLLTRFLQDKLGIQLLRKKIDANPKAKPKVEVPQKKSRKVTSIVPKIPKLPLEERLMLEAAPHPPASPKPDRSHSALAGVPVIPPIPTDADTVPDRPLSSGAQPHPPVVDKVKSRSNAWEEGEQAPPVDDQSSAFFMTQVDDQEDRRNTEQKNSNAIVHENKPKRRSKKRPDSKYKGYECLLEFEDTEEADIAMPTDMQGSIRALKYSLNHGLVYRDAAVHLDTPQKPVQPYRRKKMPESLPRKTHQQRTDEVLYNLKKRSTVQEANLQEILNDEGKSKSQVEDAQRLLAEIQRRYNAVRVNSMKEAREAKNLIQGIKDQPRKSKGVQS